MEHMLTTVSNFKIRPAAENDAGTIFSLIKKLADYERLTHEVVATENDIRRSLFGEHPFAEALIGEYERTPISYSYTSINSYKHKLLH